MRVAGKFMILLLVGVIGLLAVEGCITVRQEIDLFNADMSGDALLLGHALSGLVQETWRRAGPERAMQLIEEANEREHALRIRWVWLDVPRGDPNAPFIEKDRLAPVVRGVKASLTGNDAAGNESLYTYVPVPVDPQRPGAIEMAEPLAARNTYVRSSITRMLALTATIVILATILTVALGYFVVGRPISKLMERAQTMCDGDLSSTLPVRGHDEISKLTRQMNTMCLRLAKAQQIIRDETEARITALEQLRHADRLSTIGRLASGIAHEVGTPLNVISGRAAMIQRGNLPDGDVLDCARIIDEQAKRITTIIRQLLDFARRRRALRASADMRQLAARVIGLLEPTARKQRKSIRLTGDEATATAYVDCNQMQQVLVNLVVNAMQASPDGGVIEVETCRSLRHPPADSTQDATPETDGSEKDCVLIHVRDHGVGISEEDKPHIFDPFFTTKDVGEGTGLGLSIAYGIVKENGGWIDVESTPGKGSCFSVVLPREDAECEAES